MRGVGGWSAVKLCSGRKIFSFMAERPLTTSVARVAKAPRIRGTSMRMSRSKSASVRWDLGRKKSNDKLVDKADVYLGYRSETPSGLGYYVDVTLRTYFNDKDYYTVFNAGAGYAITEKLCETVNYSH